MKRNFALVLLTVLFIGCKTSKNSSRHTDVNKETDTPTYVVKPFSYKPSETKFFDLIHTKLDVSFDWERAHLLGSAELTVSPHAYAQTGIDLDAKGFEVAQVRMELKGNTDYSQDLSYEYDGVKIHIDFGQSVSRNDTIIIGVTYVARPNELEEGGSAAISSDKGLYFINPNGTEPFVPKQIWTQGETEASSCWFPTLDAPNQKTTSEICITVKSNFKTLSNGILTNSETLQNGLRKDTWIQDKRHAPYLVMMAVGEFSVFKDTWRGKEVNYYVEPQYANMSQEVFGNTPEMLSFYSDLLGVEYPWDKYSQIVIRDYVSGAMENTSAVTFLELLNVDSIEVNDRNWDFIIAHELFHHWFGDLVTCESWANLSLNESFANYSEYLWIKEKYGEEAGEQHISADLSNYLMEANGKRVPIVRYHYNDREDMFDRHSYEKGALVLHMLRNFLGDDIFFEGLKEYLTIKKFQSAEMQELRLVFEKVSGEDLNWFFNQWFMSAGHPELEIVGEVDGDSLELTISQNQNSDFNPIYKLPIEVLLKDGGNDFKTNFWIDSKDTVVKVPLKGINLEYYIIDPSYVLLADIQELKSNEFWERELKSDFSYHSLNRAIGVLFPTNFAVTEAEKRLGTLLLSSKFEKIRVRAAQLLSKVTEGAIIQLQIDLLSKEESPLVLRSIIKNLGEWNKDNLQHEFVAKLDFSSYLVKSELVNYIEDSVVIDSLFKVHKDYANYYLSKSLAKYFTKKQTKGKLTWLLEAYEKQKLRRKSYFIPSIVDYVSAQGVDNQEKAKQYFVDRCSNSTIESTKSSAFKALCLLESTINTEIERENILKLEGSKKQIDKYLEISLKYLINN